MNKIGNPKILFGICLAVILVAVPPFIKNEFVLNILIFIGINAILAMTNNLILRTGIWFMGHVAFYAIGAYAVLVGTRYLNLSYWVIFPIAGVLAGLMALVFGYVTRKVKGIPFAILSVALVEVVRLTIVTCMSGKPISCPSPDAILFWDFSEKIHYYYFVFLLAGLVLFFMHKVEKSRIGREINGIKENEEVAESLGINTGCFKVIILGICCGVAGLAGAVFAPYAKIVGHTSFTLTRSIIIIIYAIVGGSDSLWGPVIGAAFLTILPEILPGQASLQNIVYASAVLICLFFLPGGLVTLSGFFQDRRRPVEGA